MPARPIFVIFLRSLVILLVLRALTLHHNAVFALLCRQGVEALADRPAECMAHQCLNTTDARGATVYSCDAGAICDVLSLHDECVSDGAYSVCCCTAHDGCNHFMADVSPANAISDLPAFRRGGATATTTLNGFGGSSRM